MICARCGRSASMLFDLGAGRVWCHDCCANAGESAAQDDATLAGIIDELDTLARKHGFPPDAPVDQLPVWLAKRFEQDAETYAAAAREVDTARAWRDRVVTVACSHGFAPALDPVGLPGWLHLHLQTLAGELRMAKLDVDGKRAEVNALHAEMRQLRETIAALKPTTNH